MCNEVLGKQNLSGRGQRGAVGTIEGGGGIRGTRRQLRWGCRGGQEGGGHCNGGEQHGGGAQRRRMLPHGRVPRRATCPPWRPAAAGVNGDGSHTTSSGRRASGAVEGLYVPQSVAAGVAAVVFAFRPPAETASRSPRRQRGRGREGPIEIDLLVGPVLTDQIGRDGGPPYLNTVADIRHTTPTLLVNHGSCVQTSGFSPVGARGVAARGCLALALLWGTPGALLKSKPMTGLLKPCGVHSPWASARPEQPHTP